MTRFESAREIFSRRGIGVEAAMDALGRKAVSIHCWQGDDVTGFDFPGQGGGNGIQATGDYPGRARSFEELKEDLRLAFSLIPGKKRLNLHASYAVFPPGEWADRDELTYQHFAPWVEFARELGVGLDFNPTLFGHPRVKDGLTLSSPEEETRRFWIRHCVLCRRIAQKIGEELGDKVLCNLWIPDGYKDIPADRLGPRLRLKSALDEVFWEECPNVIDSVESKVFAVGVESYTVGSHEFYLSYAASHPGVYPLLDNGHFHPTETVSDKLPALLPFFRYLPLHVTRGVRWDSDHVPLQDDELREMMKEIVRCGAMKRVLIGLDFFDASINRIAAWVLGARSVQKALLFALLQPHESLKESQDKGDFTRRLVEMEEAKTLPCADVWAEYCARQDLPADESWLEIVKEYEERVLKKRKGLRGIGG